MTAADQQPRHQPLASYRFGTKANAGDVLARSVYIIKAHPTMVPLDVNVQWLMAQGWNPDLDRLRYSPDQLYLRRFDPQRDICVVVQLQNTMDLTLYGNDAAAVELFFEQLFIGNFLDTRSGDLNVLTRGWTDSPNDLMFYCGTVHAAFGVWGKVLVEMQLRSVTAAISM